MFLKIVLYIIELESVRVTSSLQHIPQLCDAGMCLFLSHSCRNNTCRLITYVFGYHLVIELIDRYDFELLIERKEQTNASRKSGGFFLLLNFTCWGTFPIDRLNRLK